MTWKNWVSRPPALTVSVVAGLVGLITFGCASFTADGEQQPTQGENNSTIATPSENVSANKGENNSTITTPSEAISANAPEEMPLEKDMAYREARQLLTQQGWRPNSQGESPNLRDSSVKELFELGYEEIKDCSGTGEGPCLFEFINDKGELLVVVATTRGGENAKRFVKSWWIDQKTNITQQSSSNKITAGLYWLGGTDQGLEVEGKRYRYYDEGGTKPWKSISDLKYITNGVVFDGETYWCLSTLAPQNGSAACSAKGWTQEILPFVGTKYFNFLGGSGTGRTITIKDDGSTIVKILGTVSTSVIYEGKFSNPLIFDDGDGLLIKGDKIYELRTGGQVAKGCKGEGTLCESDLYSP